MKKSIILVLVSIAFLNSCKKNPDYVSKVVDVTYPTINLIGPAFVHIPVGGTYVDQGATLIDDITGVSSHVNYTSSELNSAQPGLYQITYEAANANGFKTTAIRGVLVLNYTPPTGLDSTFDISGQYLRAATGVISNVYRLENGLYVIDHVGGSTPVPAYFVTPDTLSMDVPHQFSFGNFELDVNGEILTTSPPPVTFSYVIIADNFGTSRRTFVKQ